MLSGSRLTATAAAAVLLFVACLLLAPVAHGQAPPPLKFCRTQSATGLFQQVDIFMQEGFLYWKEWINARGGIRVAGIRRPVELKTYEDASNEEIKLLMYQRMLTVDNCDFILPTFAPPNVGLKVMQMVESGVGAIDTFLSVKKLPYMYRHGNNGALLWQGRNWTWSFSLSPSEDNRPRPCFRLYQEAGAKSAWVVVTGELAGYNTTAMGARNLLVEYNITQASVHNIPANMSEEQLRNFTRDIVEASPDLLVLRLATTQLFAELVKSIRSPSGGYQPRGIHNLGDNQLINGSTLFGLAGWALNHTTASSGWSPTDAFSDSYFGSAADLAGNISARFPNSPANELHATAATIGLLHVMAIEETDSTDPMVIRDFFHNFNRTISYGPVSWTAVGELNSAAWQCVQATSDHRVRVLTGDQERLVYPASAIPPPTPPPTRDPKQSQKTLKISLGVILGFIGLCVVAGVIAFFIFKRRHHLIVVDKVNPNDEWDVPK
jgi:hypothetical protein